MSSMSDNLNRLMEEKNIKQIDLCRETGIPTSAMSHYVRGDSDPSFTRAIRIAKALGVTTDELAGKEIKQEQERIELTDNERELLTYYRALSVKGKRAVLAGLKDFAEQ